LLPHPNLIALSSSFLKNHSFLAVIPYTSAHAKPALIHHFSLTIKIDQQTSQVQKPAILKWCFGVSGFRCFGVSVFRMESVMEKEDRDHSATSHTARISELEVL
jgi:hypothetical protein